MITISDAPNSCGLKLLGGEINYKTAETYFKDLAGIFFKQDMEKQPDNTARWAKRPLADHTMFLYTHAPKLYTIGSLIKDYIEKHNLGTVVVSAEGNNPVHDRKIAVWVWTRDNIAFAKHCKELLAPKETEVKAKPKTETK